VTGGNERVGWGGGGHIASVYRVFGPRATTSRGRAVSTRAGDGDDTPRAGDGDDTPRTGVGYCNHGRSSVSNRKPQTGQATTSGAARTNRRLGPTKPQSGHRRRSGGIIPGSRTPTDKSPRTVTCSGETAEP
jgi:hypothetical protein